MMGCKDEHNAAWIEKSDASHLSTSAGPASLQEKEREICIECVSASAVEEHRVDKRHLAEVYAG